MRRPDNEPLLFDLPLDRPARDGRAEPELDRQPPPRAPRGEGPPPSRTATHSALQPSERTASAAAAASTAARMPPPAPPAALPSIRPASRRPRDRQAPIPDQADLAARPELSLPADHLPFAAAGDPMAGGGAAIGALQGMAATSEESRVATLERRPVAGAASEEGQPAGRAAAATADGQAGIGRRLAAAAADLLVHAAVTVLALAGCRYLGVLPVLDDWPAMAVFLLSFSFLYTVVPLAFWGHTLGMTWAGLTADSADGQPLSFDQTARRWLGALLTLATLGLPLLLALGGRSLADRLSGSRTLVT
jgi:uncharacterized RDD family membrane protein YckC